MLYFRKRDQVSYTYKTIGNIIIHFLHTNHFVFKEEQRNVHGSYLELHKDNYIMKPGQEYLLCSEWKMKLVMELITK
jgi:hypothetical protein